MTEKNPRSSPRAKHPTTPESRAAQSRLAALTRDLGPSHPMTVAAHQRWSQLAFVARATAALAEPPELTVDQVAELRRAWDGFMRSVVIVSEPLS